MSSIYTIPVPHELVPRSSAPLSEIALTYHTVVSVDLIFAMPWSGLTIPTESGQESSPQVPTVLPCSILRCRAWLPRSSLSCVSVAHRGHYGAVLVGSRSQ